MRMRKKKLSKMFAIGTDRIKFSNLYNVHIQLSLFKFRQIKFVTTLMA